jgi:hypothetical protein
MRGWSDQLSGGRANEYGGRAFVRGVLKGLRDYIHQQLLRVARQYASREGKRDMSQLWDEKRARAGPEERCHVGCRENDSASRGTTSQATGAAAGLKEESY